MIEWKEFDKGNPPTAGTSHIAVGATEIISHGHYNHSLGRWINQMGDEIRFVTHYAEINLPLKEPK